MRTRFYAYPRPLRAAVKAVSAKWSPLDSAIMQLHLAGLLSKAAARRLHKRTAARWEAEIRATLRAGRRP